VRNLPEHASAKTIKRDIRRHDFQARKNGRREGGREGGREGVINLVFYLVAGRANDAVPDAEHGRGDVLEGDGRDVVIVRGGGLEKEEEERKGGREGGRGMRLVEQGVTGGEVVIVGGFDGCC